MNLTANIGAIIFYMILFGALLARMARRKEGKMSHLLLDVAVVVAIVGSPFVFYFLNSD